MVTYVSTWEALDSGYTHRSEEARGTSTTLVTYRFHTWSNLPTSVYYDADSIEPLTLSEQSTFRRALAEFEQIANIKFVETDEDANININGVSGSAWGGWSSYPYTSGNMSLDSKSMSVMLHEIGHALGLKHPFDGDIQLESSLDKKSVTIMSYTSDIFNQTELSYLDEDALVQIYGAATTVPSWSTTVSGGVLHITGSSGEDRMNSANYQLNANGGKGNDYIVGSWMSDSLAGGEGDDDLHGGYGSDKLYGGLGGDELRGGDGFDSLYGGEGNDLLWGNDYADTIYAGPGDDTARGGWGSDKVHGEAGADMLIGSRGWDYLDGGSGDDRVLGGGDADTVDGGFGNDVLKGNSDGDVVSGEEGDDTVLGGSGADRLYGGDGHDNMNGNGLNDTLWGDAGHDVVKGGAGNDFLIGGGGRDTLIGGREDDILYGNNGYGEPATSGADTFVFRGTFGHDSIYDFEIGIDEAIIARFHGRGYDSADDYIDANASYSGGVVTLTVGENSIAFYNFYQVSDIHGALVFG